MFNDAPIKTRQKRPYYYKNETLKDKKLENKYYIKMKNVISFKDTLLLVDNLIIKLRLHVEKYGIEILKKNMLNNIPFFFFWKNQSEKYILFLHFIQRERQWKKNPLI